MAANETPNAPKRRAKAAPESAESVPECRLDGVPQRDEGGSVPIEGDPPRAENSRRRDNPSPESPAAERGGSESHDVTPNAHGVTTRRRGRKRIRSIPMVRTRQNEIADKVVNGTLDPKAGAIAVQALNGVLACLRAEKDLDFEKRMEAIEARLGGARKRGGDA